jgi:hypothetical protein
VNTTSARFLAALLFAPSFASAQETAKPPQPPKYYEGTISASIPVGTGAELRIEGRRDFSDKAVFKASTEKDQTTIQVAALAWF